MRLGRWGESWVNGVAIHAKGQGQF
jgi:hypothetical protein